MSISKFASIIARLGAVLLSVLPEVAWNSFWNPPGLYKRSLHPARQHQQDYGEKHIDRAHKAGHKFLSESIARLEYRLHRSRVASE